LRTHARADVLAIIGGPVYVGSAPKSTVMDRHVDQMIQSTSSEDHNHDLSPLSFMVALCDCLEELHEE
jgi:hypothetical protein